MSLPHSALETYAATAHVRYRLLAWLCPLLIVAMAMQPGAAQERSPGTLQDQFAKLESLYVKIVWPTEQNNNMEIHIFPEGMQKRIRKEIQEYADTDKRGQQIQQEYQELLKQMVKTIDLKSLLTKPYESVQNFIGRRTTQNTETSSRFTDPRERFSHKGDLRLKQSTTQKNEEYIKFMSMTLQEVNAAMNETDSTSSLLLLHEILSRSVSANARELPEDFGMDSPPLRLPFVITHNLWDPHSSTMPKDYDPKKHEWLIIFTLLVITSHGDSIVAELKSQLGESWQKADSLYGEKAKIDSSFAKYAGRSPMTDRYEYYLLVRSQQDFLELVPAIENGQRELIPKNRISRVVFLPEPRQ